MIHKRSSLPWPIRSVGSRIHLFEVHDLDWCPPMLRRVLQDMLAFNWTLKAPGTSQSAADLFVPFLLETLDKAGSDDIIDLCSGGGGPCAALACNPQVKGRVKSITLTDLFPNLSAFEALSEQYPQMIKYSPEPVDATNCSFGEPSKRYVRMMCLSMHHMTEDLLESILRDCVKRGDAFLAAEALNRSMALSVSFFLGPIMALTFLLIDLYRKPSLHRLVETILLAFIFPIVAAFDGTVSGLRVYSLDEFAAIVRRADPEQKFEWTIFETQLPGSFVPYTYYRGVPKVKSS